MRLLLYALAIIATTSAPGKAISGTEAKGATKSLDGAWQCISIVGHLGPSPDDIVKTIKINIAGTKAALTAGGKTVTFSIKADFTKKPAEIDVVPEDGPAKGK